MVKKRRQSDPHVDGSDSSSDSGHGKIENNRHPSCIHLKKSIDDQQLRKTIKAATFSNEKCVQCEKMPNANHEPTDFEYDKTLWLCMKCGANSCGRAINGHALKHYETPRSDKHTLALNTTTWEVWCYPCDNNVDTSNRRISSCIEFIKKELNKVSTPKENGVVRAENNDGTAEINIESMRSLLGNTISIVTSLSSNSSIPGQAKRVSTSTVEQLPRVRGLSNLGNTCFFNAVTQCLAQTPYLLDVLKELSLPNEEFELPGGKLKLKDAEDEIELPPVFGALSVWGPLTTALAETLEELRKSGGVHNPRKLFSQLTSKQPQFGGGDQHDSHELLRHLLESVKNEDLKRYQKVILSFLKYKGQELHLVPDEMKQKCKFYGQQASDRILCPEQVFRGFLVSTLTCQDCFHKSSRHENFLDLSLPVCVEKPAPPIRRKSSPEDMNSHKDNATSKSKQKAANKKANHNTASSQEESDADVEDNLSEDVSSNQMNRNKETNGNNEIKSEKQDDVPETLDKDVNDSKINSINNEVLELGISCKGGQDLAKQISQEDDKSKVVSTSLMDSFQNLKMDAQSVKKRKEKRKRLYSHTDWSTTIAPRYQCEDNECSIQSCLNNFTAVELMTGNNKVGCEQCSERINGKGGKTINTNATKQFLISSPPAVLILHLKRFQVGPRCMFRKLSKHVAFPFTLDLAPFCASRVKTLPNVHRHQKKLIYSLYGIVEHSGSMHGGHYVAYVKVRPNLPPSDPRWQFLPQGSKVELDQTDEQKQRLDEALKKDQLKEDRMKSGDSDDCTSSSSSSSAEETAFSYNASNCGEPPILRSPPEGKWYYVSDSHVSEASEERVLAAQAYLLFYERIY